MVRVLVAGLSVGLVAGCVEPESCDGRTDSLAGEGASESFAVHLRIDEAQLTSVDVSLSGARIVNRSADVDCTVAIYEFAALPRREELPALAVGDVAPAELPGGGVLLEQHFLPRSGDRRFTVPIAGPDWWHMSKDTWLIGLTCPEADVAVEMQWDFFGCRPGDVPPGQNAMGAAKLW